jgi:hypothetical protein
MDEVIKCLALTVWQRRSSSQHPLPPLLVRRSSVLAVSRMIICGLALGL